MSKLSNDERVITTLREAFGPTVEFELTKESDTVYRVKVTAAEDGPIADGLEAMKAARVRSAIDGNVAVKMISDVDANAYLNQAASTHDPVARAGYQALADDARGK